MEKWVNGRTIELTVITPSGNGGVSTEGQDLGKATWSHTSRGCCNISFQGVFISQGQFLEVHGNLVTYHPNI